MIKFITTILVLAGTHAYAVEYNCVDKNRQTGTLRVDNYSHSLTWYPHRGAKLTGGTVVGIEKAPYSPWKGYRLFQLTNWPITNDSSWILAIEPNRHNDPSIVIYLDNDDHPEKEQYYRCYKTKN